jgi:hypothetical protein
VSTSSLKLEKFRDQFVLVELDSEVHFVTKQTEVVDKNHRTTPVTSVSLLTECVQQVALLVNLEGLDDLGGRPRGWYLRLDDSNCPALR